MALGVLWAFVYSMTLLPAMLSLVPLRARRIPSDKSPFFERLGAFVVKRRAFLLCCIAVLTAGSHHRYSRNELTDRWAHYFDERYRFRRDSDFIFDNLNSMNFLEYALKAGAKAASPIPNT